MMMSVLFMLLMVSCQKENHDISETAKEEITPEANYTGDDNTFNFTKGKWDHPSFSYLELTGGTSLENQITKENLTNGDIRWTVISTITDGITVTNEISFVTPNTDAGTYQIEEIHYKSEDGSGIIEEHTWVTSEISNGVITVSALDDAPGIVSGNTGDVQIIIIPDSVEYHYYADWSEVPIN